MSFKGVLGPIGPKHVANCRARVGSLIEAGFLAAGGYDEIVSQTVKSKSLETVSLNVRDPCHPPGDVHDLCEP